MKKEVQISEKSKEEAIAKAVEELGAPSADVLLITVIQEARKGFLGFGAVPCTIKAVYQIPDQPREGGNGEKRSKRDRGPRQGGKKQAPREPKVEEEIVEIDLPPMQAKEPKPDIDPSEATESERCAYDFIVRLAADMGLTVKVTMHPGDNDDMVIAVDGDTAGAMIGHHGETLDAIQYLANLAANRKEEGEKRDFARITVDVESYRAKREVVLRTLARRKAAMVLKNKKSIMLEPMNPYERRIIHSEIQRIDGISTNSIGVENNRRVVIFLEEDGNPATINGNDVKAKKAKPKAKAKKKPATESEDPLSHSTRQMESSSFAEDDVRDPFDIDLSAATYTEEETTESSETTETIE